MTWFKVDDRLAFSPKALAAGNPAMGLWVRAGSWSAQQLSDGYVPGSIVQQMGSTAPAQAERLVTAGLWVPVVGGGYVFHDWEQYQPSRAAVESDRQARRERTRRWRERRMHEP